MTEKGLACSLGLSFLVAGYMRGSRRKLANTSNEQGISGPSWKRQKVDVICRQQSQSETKKAYKKVSTENLSDELSRICLRPIHNSTKDVRSSISRYDEKSTEELLEGTVKYITRKRNSSSFSKLSTHPRKVAKIDHLDSSSLCNATKKRPHSVTYCCDLNENKPKVRKQAYAKCTVYDTTENNAINRNSAKSLHMREQHTLATLNSYNMKMETLTIGSTVPSEARERSMDAREMDKENIRPVLPLEYNTDGVYSLYSSPHRLSGNHRRGTRAKKPFQASENIFD